MKLIQATLGIALLATPLPAAEPADRVPSVASSDEFLRHLPKKFATLTAVDAGRRSVTLLAEGDAEPRSWSLAPDAEVKVSGWWGRVEQLTIGDRVWAWFNIDRRKQPTTVAMLADEVSEQEIHGLPYSLKVVEAQAVLTRAKYPERRLAFPKDAPADGTVYVQSAGDRARLLLTPAAFEARRAEQKQWLQRHWLANGLPGTVTVLHPLSGEMEVMLDHEAGRWARSLRTNDAVEIRATPPIKGKVRSVSAWRERTVVRLVVIGTDQADLTMGQRCGLVMAAPPAEVTASPYPADIDRPRPKAERVDWFLANVYCTCPVAKDTCTGHFYSLASCNVNGCGMPAATTKRLTELIDKGLSDREIWDLMLKERGPMLTRPHLLP